MKTRIGLALAAVLFARPRRRWRSSGPLRRRSCSATSTPTSSFSASFPIARNSPTRRRNRRRDDILALYRAEKPLTAAALKRFVSEHFDLPASVAVPGAAAAPAPIRQHIDALWPVLTRETPTVPPYSSLLPLPRPYVVPGGRFRELYYWDSYFTMLGLAESGRADLLEDMVQNFAASHRRLRPHSERDAVLLPHPLAAAVLLRHGRPSRSRRPCGGLRPLSAATQDRIRVLDGGRGGLGGGRRSSPRGQARRRLDPQSLLGRQRRAARRVLCRGRRPGALDRRGRRKRPGASFAPPPRAAGISARAGSPTGERSARSTRPRSFRSTSTR